jgi:hypothetical protein
MKTAAAGGADVIGACAFTVFMAIWFQFVTSLPACATAGNASATVAASTAYRPTRAFFTPQPFMSPPLLGRFRCDKLAPVGSGSQRRGRE